MERMHLRIGVQGRLSETTARSLGGWIDEGDGGFELVVPYVDQPQVTGLLVRLGDLHIAFDHVAVSSCDTPPDPSGAAGPDATPGGATS